MRNTVNRAPCFQDDHIGGRSGLHLCDLRHVLCAGQLRPLPD